MLSSFSAQVSRCGTFSCCGLWALGHAGSAVVMHGLSCPVTCGIFLDEEPNPCPLQGSLFFRHVYEIEVVM